MNFCDKSELKRELLALLEAQRNALVATHEATIAGATHEENKPENDKDTRAIEQQYLARGQAGRIAELEAGLSTVRALVVRPASQIGVGALVTVEDEDGERRLFFAPYGGGLKLANAQVQVVTPQAPLGRALLGKTEGDEVDATLGGKRRMIAVSGVS